MRFEQVIEATLNEHMAHSDALTGTPDFNMSTETLCLSGKTLWQVGATSGKRMRVAAAHPAPLSS